jgi:transcriptional regulator with XRE-family HTH domain
MQRSIELNSAGTVGAEIRRVRQAQGVTLRALASRLAVSPSLLTLVEQANHVPRIELLVDIAAALDVDADVLCGLAGKLTPRAERALAQLAKTEPALFRSVIERHARAR